MAEFTDIMGAEQEAFTFNGDNYIDVFPVFVFDSARATNPRLGDITVQGVTYRSEEWDLLDEKTTKFELNHQYKSGETLELHTRIMPFTDTAGTINFSYTYYIMHDDGTTSAGGVVTGTETIVAGDKTANIGRYVGMPIAGTGLVSGDQLIGTFKRTTGTYVDEVSVEEIGLHIPVGKTGDNIVLE